jgi:hypothetical protein
MPISHCAPPRRSSASVSVTDGRGLRAGPSESMAIGDGILLMGDTGLPSGGSNDSMPGSLRFVCCVAGLASGSGAVVVCVW